MLIGSASKSQHQVNKIVNLIRLFPKMVETLKCVSRKYIQTPTTEVISIVNALTLNILYKIM